jgi:hypothetical protein
MIRIKSTISVQRHYTDEREEKDGFANEKKRNSSFTFQTREANAEVDKHVR